MQSRSHIPWLEIVLLAAGFTVLALLGGLQSREPVNSLASRSTYDTSRGGYAAWYELMRREGDAVERFEQQPAFLDKAIDTLVVADGEVPPGGTIPYSKADIAALGAWVRAGGRAVLVTGYSSAFDAEATLVPKPKNFRNVPPRDVVAPELVRLGIARIETSNHARVIVKPHGHALFADRFGAVVVHYRLGKGEVLAIADPTPFQNSKLGEADDARAAYSFASPRRAGGIVAFDEAIHGYIIPYHWWNALSRAFVLAVILSALVLAIALAGAAIRLGPPLVPEPDRQATSAEYVNAVATLLERRRAAAHAIRTAAEATRRAVASLGPTALQPSVAANLLELDRLAEIPQPSERNLISALACSYAIRKELTTHGRTG